MLDLVDHFGGTFIIFVFAILEVYAVVYLYGLENFCLDLEFMTNHKPGIYWRVCWGLIMPVLLVVIFIYFLATLPTLTYGIYNHEFPAGVLAFGWCILAVGVLQAILAWILWILRSRVSVVLHRKLGSERHQTNAALEKLQTSRTRTERSKRQLVR